MWRCGKQGMSSPAYQLCSYLTRHQELLPQFPGQVENQISSGNGNIPNQTTQDNSGSLLRSEGPFVSACVGIIPGQLYCFQMLEPDLEWNISWNISWHI